MHGWPEVIHVEIFGVEEFGRVVHVCTASVLRGIIGGSRLRNDAKTEISKECFAVIVDEDVALEMT